MDLAPMKLTHPMSPEQMEHIRVADVVLARDKDGKQILFYGRPTLERIVETGDDENVRTMMFDINAASRDLELLAAAVQVIKGEHHYQSTPD